MATFVGVYFVVFRGVVVEYYERHRECRQNEVIVCSLNDGTIPLGSVRGVVGNNAGRSCQQVLVSSEYRGFAHGKG
jgi:hypothetical protein